MREQASRPHAASAALFVCSFSQRISVPSPGNSLGRRLFFCCTEGPTQKRTACYEAQQLTLIGRPSLLPGWHAPCRRRQRKCTTGGRAAQLFAQGRTGSASLEGTCGAGGVAGGDGGGGAGGGARHGRLLQGMCATAVCTARYFWHTSVRAHRSLCPPRPSRPSWPSTRWCGRVT